MKEIAPRIVVDENIRFGKPVIKGTRVAVTTILGHLAAGDAPEELAHEYGIVKEDIFACISYALWIVDDEVVHVV